MKSYLITLFCIYCMATTYAIDITIPNKSAIVSLIDSSIDIDDYLLRTDNDNNLYMLANNKLYNLSDTSSILVMSLDGNLSITDFFVTHDKNVICAIDSFLFICNQNEEIEPFLQSNVINCHFSLSGRGISYFGKGDTTLFLLSFQQQQQNPIPIFNSPDAINSHIEEDGLYIIATNKELTMYDSEDNMSVSLISSKDSITSVAFGINGSMFYGTTKNLYFVDKELHSIPIANTGVKEILQIENSLIVHFSNNLSVLINNIENYNNLADSIQIIKHGLPISIINYKTTILNNGDSINMTDIYFTSIPGKGLYSIVGTTLISMEPDRLDIPDFSFPDSSYYCEQVVFLSSIITYKSANSILYVNERKKTRGFELNTDSFSIAYASDTSIYVLTKGQVFEFNPRQGKPRIIFTAPVPEDIIMYSVFASDTLVAFDNKLCFKKNKQCQILAELPQKIACIDISMHGIWIGTSDGLYRYNGRNKLICVDEKPIRQILNDGDYLYIITENSSIYRLQRVQNEILSEKNTKSKNRKGNGI